MCFFLLYSMESILFCLKEQYIRKVDLGREWWMFFY